MIFLVFVEGRHVRWCLINVIPDLCNHWRGICAKLRRSKEFEDDVLEPWQKKTISHGIHVWYIYLHVVHFCGKRERGKFFPSWMLWVHDLKERLGNVERWCLFLLRRCLHISPDPTAVQQHGGWKPEKKAHDKCTMKMLRNGWNMTCDTGISWYFTTID